MSDRITTSRGWLCLFLIGLVLASRGSAVAQTAVVPPGTGTSADPYLISQLGHLVWMGDTYASSSGKYYTMTADIDASPTATWNDPGTDTRVLEGFRPIGSEWPYFEGVFEGNGHRISGLVINRRSATRVGLFGGVRSSGQVSNLGLVGGSVTGQSEVGSMVGALSGMLSGCYATGTVCGDREVGGLVGYGGSCVIQSCYAAGLVLGLDAAAGGLVGSHHGTLSSSYATGAVRGTDHVGGLVGSGDEGLISRCYAPGPVEGNNACWGA